MLKVIPRKTRHLPEVLCITFGRIHIEYHGFFFNFYGAGKINKYIEYSPTPQFSASFPFTIHSRYGGTLINPQKNVFL